MLTHKERERLLSEQERLLDLAEQARRRFARCMPRQKAAYHAHICRSRKSLERLELKAREQGYTFNGNVLVQMTEEERLAYRRWKGEA